MKDKHGLGQRLLAIRKAFSLTQVQMADLLGLTRSGLSQIETGVIATPVDLIYSTVSKFDISFSWLMMGGDEMFVFNDPEKVVFAERRLGFHDKMIANKSAVDYKDLIAAFIKLHCAKDEKERRQALGKMNEVRNPYSVTSVMSSLKSSPNSSLTLKDKINHVSEGVHLTTSAIDVQRLAENFHVSELEPRREDAWASVVKDDIIVATQDTKGNPTFSLVNYKAAANYLTGYQSQDYFSNLAPISLPRQLVGNPRQGIVLQIEGDSMTPRFQHGDYVAAILLDKSEWGQIRDLDCYVVVSHSHGIQFKRIKSRLKQFGFIRCKSDNRRHSSYNIEEEDLIQLFRFVLHISPDASNTDETLFNKVESIEERVEDQRDMYEQLAQRMEDMQRLLQQQLPPASK